MMVSSLLALAKKFPCGDTVTLLIQSVCPYVIVCKQTPLKVSQIRIDWSLEQEMRKSV